MPNRLARFEEGATEQLSVQEVFIRFAGANSKAIEVRKLLQRDFVGDLETKLKIRRNFFSQTSEILVAGKRIVGRINANRLEHLRVFAQAVPLKTRLGHLAPILVSCGRVELAEPALVSP